MKRMILSTCAGAGFLALTSFLTAQEQTTLTADEAHAIGVDAYVYFYPLLSMEISRQTFTNVAPGNELGKGPMNTFPNVPEYPPADFKGVVRSNFDTLYSSGWLDLTKDFRRQRTCI